MHMRRLLPLFCVCLMPAALAEHALPDAAAIDARARELMTAQGVEGLALAVIDGGVVQHVATFGSRNVEQRLALTPDTVMYGASLTKTAVAYLVLQYVDEGLLDLDASVADLLPKPLPEYDGQGEDEDNNYTDLAGDPRWRDLTPRLLLNHATGFANFRWLEDDRRLRMHHDPGDRYGYSAEGFYILQLIIEAGLGFDLEQEMQRRVFAPLGLTRTSLRWRADFASNLADGYGLDGSFEPHDERSGVSAAGSMDTTIADQAKLWAGIVRGDFLSPAARRELVRPQLPIRSAHQFPSLSSEQDPTLAEVELAAGLGLVTLEGPQGAVFFKGGHNPWTGNNVVCLDAQQRCLVMLANDVRAERIYPEMVAFVLGDTGVPWRWEYSWFEE